MIWAYLLGGGLILAFGLVVVVGPPFLPTLGKQMQAALDLLDLQPGQVLLELGSGDGRVVLAAAERGWKVVGIELNPVLVVYARLRTWRYRKQVTIIWGDYFRMRWPDTDAIFTFMLPRLMPQLDRTIEAWHRRPVRLASFAFEIPGKTPVAKDSGVFLYEYK